MGSGGRGCGATPTAYIQRDIELLSLRIVAKLTQILLEAQRQSGAGPAADLLPPAIGGLRIDTNAQVISIEGEPIPGLYAAGELVGGIFYFNYPGGTGLTNGAVFGRIAGASAGAMSNTL